MADFLQRNNISVYVENQVMDERVHKYYEAMYGVQRPEVRDLSFNCDADIPALMCNAGLTAPNGTHLGLHNYGRPSDATPKDRFGIISSANDPFPLHAKMAMEELNIGQGDKLNVERRYGNVGWGERNMPRGEEEDQTSSMKPMKVTMLKAETKARARATKMRRERRGRH